MVIAYNYPVTPDTPTSITLVKGNVTCLAYNVTGNQYNLKENIKVEPEAAKDNIEYVLSPDSIVAVDNNGIVTLKDGVTSGEAAITIKSKFSDTIKAEFKVIVIESKVVADYDRDTTYFIDKNGRLYAWSGNNYGQVGNGSTTKQTTPYEVEFSQ